MSTTTPCLTIRVSHTLMLLLIWSLAFTTPWCAQAEDRLSVVYCVDAVPFQFQNETGKPDGVIIDMWKLWSEKTGVQVDFVPAIWEKTLSLTREGKVDAHAGLFYTKERDQFLDYGTSLTETDTHIFYHDSLPQLVAGAELLPYRVGVIDEDYVEGYLKKNIPNIFITGYPNYDTMMSALQDGTLKTFAADTPAALHYLNKYDLNTQFQFHAARPLYRNEWFIAVQEGKTSLLETINAGMTSISDEERNAIVRNWSQTGARRDADTIVIAIDRNYPPLYFMGSNGTPKGLLVDIWQLWAQKVGQKIDFRPSDWTDSIEALKTGQADIHGGLFESDDRRKWMDFDKTLYRISTGLYYKKGSTANNLGKLEGKRVGVVGGSMQEHFLRTAHPKAEAVPYTNAEDLLLGLLKNEVTAIVDEIPVMEAVSHDMGLRGVLARAPEKLMTNSIHPAVAKGNQKLLARITKGLSRITQKELAELEQQWITNPAQRYYSLSGSSEGVKLTHEEAEWVKNNPQITVAVMDNWPPVSWVDNQGDIKGVDADMIRLVGKRIGLEINVRAGPFKNELDAVRNKEIDAIMGATPKPERKAFLNFTKNYLEIPHAIVGRSYGPKFEQEKALRGKTLVLEEGFGINKYFKDNYPDITIINEPSTLACLEALSDGKADAYVGNRAVARHLIVKHLLTTLEVQGKREKGGSILAIGVRKDNPILASILDKGLGTVDLRDRNKLLSKYVSQEIEKKKRKKVILTDEERQWIVDHPDIRLGIDPEWPPFEFFQGVTHSGLSAEYIKLLSKDTGITFAAPPIFNWSQVLRYAQDKMLDILPSVARTKDREDFLSFSEPYSNFPLVVYQRTDDIPVKSMADLEGKSLAVVQGYAITEHLKDHHSAILIKEHINLTRAIESLSKGKVSGMIANPIVVEALRQKLSIFNIAPTIKTPYPQELRFGVRKDWPQLVKIINKWLDTIPDDMRLELEKKAGIDRDVFVGSEATKQSMNLSQFILLGGGIIVVFAVSILLTLFLRRLIRSRAETLYSSHQYKVVGIFVGLLFLCLVVVVTWYALQQVENRVRYTVGQSLESVLLTTHEALAIWEKQHQQAALELAESPILRGLTSALLTIPKDKVTIETSPPLFNLRRFLKKAQKNKGFSDFAIISKEKLNFASGSDCDLLDKNTISIQRPRLLDKAFLGQTVFIPPIKVVAEEDSCAKTGLYVAIATPIMGQNSKVLASLILYYDASNNYQRIIEMGRIGNSGETYAVDNNGGLISYSRFADTLFNLGLVENGQRGILNLRLADPGGNLLEGHVLDKETLLPLTLSAQSVTLHNHGINMEGYRDYRGKKVFGTWLWNNQLGLGLITEIDEQEALGAYRLVRNTVVAVIFITILLGSLMTGLSNWIGQSAARSLRKAKEELEDRVEERTAELKKITVAVEQSPATVVITDKDGTIQYVNPTFCEVTGYTEEEAIGQNPRVLKAGAHPPEFYREMWDTILSGKVWNGDLLNRKKDGTVFWERASIAPIFNDDGELTNFVAVKEDITDRKAQEERFQALLDAAPDAMVIVDHDGTINLVNLATEELFGYEREALIGSKVEMLLPEYIRDAHPRFREKFFARPGDLTLVANKNFVGQTSSGDTVPVDISLSPIETDEGIQIIASIRDITERKKAEAAIAESEERTRLILSSAGEGIFGVNLKGNVIFINNAALTMLGYEEHEIMGKEVHALIHHTRPDGSYYPVEECPMRDAFVEGISSRIDDEVLWRKDGTSFFVEYAAVPVLREGEKIGAVISFTDISIRKLAQEERDDAYQIITSSIQYASRIQKSVLPPASRLADLTVDHSIVWEPRDVVGGDLYWCELWGEGAVLILGDCTGHGVPGAFMTLLATGALKRALAKVPEGDAAGVVSAMHQSIQNQLGQNRKSDMERTSDDGLELGVCYLAPDNNTITYAGARMPMFIDNGESVEIIKADKKGIGYRSIPFDYEYTNKIIKLNTIQDIYMTTDGLIDQIGGEKRRGFGKKRFIALLESLRDLPMTKRGDRIHAQLLTYQGKEKRRDDVSIIGFTI